MDGDAMTRNITYATITGVPLRYRARKPGPRPLPAELRRPCRVIASVKQSTRTRLDTELSFSPFSESDMVEKALLMLFEQLEQERLLSGLLYSNLVTT